MQLYNTLSAEERAQLIDEAGKQRLTLSFYAYAKISDPKKFRDELFIAWNALDALGRIYVANEGINAQMSIPEENLEAFRETLDVYDFMKGIRLNEAVEHDDHSFLKLTIKVRNKIVADGLNDETFDVTNKGIILVDSGGQYLEGTTDITRTLAIGEVSEEFKIDSTLVLQGMIRLSMVKFPKGTRGVQLDAIARLPLWMAGKDYAHGTGHGVGSFMNVHEGPQNIRKDLNPQELLPGMVVSNEPGFYLENKYGIRHENLVVVKEVETTDFGIFYDFETLTFCPFFKDIIVKDMLSQDEIDWLNAYHKQCEEKIGPHLDGEIKTWFLDLVSPL